MPVELVEMKTNVCKPVVDGCSGMAAPDLKELAELVGIECEYVDGRGHVHQATDEALRGTLRAVGVDVQSASDISREKIRIQEERWTNVVEPVLLHYPETRRPFCFPIAFPLGDSSLESIVLECRLKDERGKIHSSTVQGSTCALIEEAVIQGARFVRIQVGLPERIRLGYFDLIVRIKIGAHVIEASSLVIAAPRRCYCPPGRKRQWGIGVQLYSIRSRNNWGSTLR